MIEIDYALGHKEITYTWGANFEVYGDDEDGFNFQEIREQVLAQCWGWA